MNQGTEWGKHRVWRTEDEKGMGKGAEAGKGKVVLNHRGP